MLTFCQGCQQNDLAVWEFQRVVMAPRIVWVDLPEDRGLVAADLFFTPRPETFAPNLVCKGQLRPWQHADSYADVFRRSEASRACAKVAGG